MKKLLIITDMFPDEYNPVSGIFVKQQADELAKYYHIKVIATSAHVASDFTATLFKEQNYDVHRLNSPLNNFSFFLSIFSFFRDAIPAIRAIISSWKPDIIHVHDCRHVPELFALRHELDKNKIRTYLTVHNIKSHPSLIRNFLSRQLYRLTMMESYSNWNHIFTVNSMLKKELSRFDAESNISVIGNGVPEYHETETTLSQEISAKLKPDAFKILSVGNLIKEKGFDILIQAVEALKMDSINIQVIIVGGGPEQGYLKKMIAQNKLQESIILVQRQPNSLVRSLYPLFDAFVLPSYHETFGIVYLEAMYAKLPVIGVRNQGIDGTIINMKNGLLVEPQNTDDLKEKIKFLIQNPEIARKLAEEGKNFVGNNYMINNIVEKIMLEYENY